MRRALDPHTVLYLKYVHVHISHLMLASLALNLVLSHYVGSRVHVGVSEHCILTMYVLSSTGRITSTC